MLQDVEVMSALLDLYIRLLDLYISNSLTTTHTSFYKAA
jgi:hypothetical protein